MSKPFAHVLGLSVTLTALACGGCGSAPSAPPAIPNESNSAPPQPPEPAAGAGGDPAPPQSVPPASSTQQCGGITGLQCPDGQYCNYAPEAQCGAADMTGTCADVPDVCTMQLDEVCGCDDKTYSNACVAARSGVSVAMKGPCPKR